MKRTNKYLLNPWTSALVAAGVVSIGSVLQAEEAQNPVMTALSSTTISGYVDTSAIWKMGPDTDGAFLPGRLYDNADRMNQFNLNVVELNIARPADRTTDWAAGYKVSLLFGPDANLFGSTSTLSTGTSDFAIKNAYVDLWLPVQNGLNVKIGVWDTVIGYEVFESGNNPNYSRSYGYYLEPQIHTGVLATYQLSDYVTVQGGIANDSNQINYHPSRGKFAYMGAVTLTAPDSFGALSGATLSGGVVSTGRADLPNTYNYYVGATLPTPIEGLNVGVAFDYFGTGEYADDTTQYAYALAGYLTYKVTDQLKTACRVDWAKSGDSLFGVWAPGNDEVEFLAVTGTIDYALWANVISRLEFRWDHDLKSSGLVAGMDNAYTLALNVIYNF